MHLNHLDNVVLSLYNATSGGTHEYLGAISTDKELAAKEHIVQKECRHDDLSEHKAKTCKVILTRLTQKGISEGRRLAVQKTNETEEFLKSVEHENPRIEFL